MSKQFVNCEGTWTKRLLWYFPGLDFDDFRLEQNSIRALFPPSSWHIDGNESVFVKTPVIANISQII